MSEQTGRVVMAELIIPLAAIVFTVYYIWSVSAGPWEAKFSAYLIGIPLLITSAIFVLIRLWRLLQHHPSAARPLPAEGSATSLRVNAIRLALLVLTLGYILMIDYGAGFTLSNFIFLTCGILLLSGFRQPLRALGVAATLSLCGYLLFIVAFNTRFPEGPIERVLEQLFS
jgi:hypothetical protein